MSDEIPKNIKDISDKITSMDKKIPSAKMFILPKDQYQPFCMKILHAFIEHHNLPYLPLPEGSLLMHLCMSRIFDCMLYSMGMEKRDEFIKDLEEYKISLETFKK
jgi:hypothetical protein